jgi:integrase
MSRMDENIEWALTYASGRRFNDTITAEPTRDSYLRYLRRYSETVKKTPDELIALKLEGLQNLNTEKEFQAEDLLDNYLYTSEIKEKPNLQNMTLRAVKAFYSATRGRALQDDVGKRIKLPEPKQRKPEMQDLLDLDEVMFSARDRAILWFLESCPVRVGTLKQLLWKDLVPTNDPDVPFKIVIDASRLKGHYKGSRHIGFLHSYSAMKLKKYEEELKQMGINKTLDSPLFVAYKDAYKKVDGQLVKKQSKGGRLYGINNLFVFASLNAWKDLRVKRFSPHDMRDVLQSIMESPEVSLNENLIKPFLSHVIGGVEKHYSSHNESEYMTAFKMALPWIRPKTVSKVEAERQKDKEENEKEKLETSKVIETMKEEHKKDIDEMKAKFDEFLQWIDGGKLTILPKDNKHKYLVTREKQQKPTE